MDYLKQLKGYRQKRLAFPISSGAICLYFILLEYDNDLFFTPEFCIANSTLQGLSGLSLKAMVRAREELCEKGYLLYRKGHAGHAGHYTIVDLSVLCQPFKRDVDAAYAGEGAGGISAGTYNKQNKTNFNKGKRAKKEQPTFDLEELEYFSTYNTPTV